MKIRKVSFMLGIKISDGGKVENLLNGVACTDGRCKFIIQNLEARMLLLWLLYTAMGICVRMN